MIQRSYNAYAVRVQDTNPNPTAGGMMGGLSHGADKGAGTLRVVPASETKEGVLCIEMRIRLYNDGAMSKLLEKLAKVCGWRPFCVACFVYGVTIVFSQVLLFWRLFVGECRVWGVYFLLLILLANLKLAASTSPRGAAAKAAPGSFSEYCSQK